MLWSGTTHPKTASNIKAWRSKSTGSSGGYFTSNNSLAAPFEHKPKLSQNELITFSADPTRLGQDQGSELLANTAHDLFHQIPQISLDSTFSPTESITSCKNPRQRMALRRYKMSGYLVKYVGNTVYSEGQLGQQPEPDNKNHFMIVVTYDDAWALVIKRDSGRKLIRSSIAVLNGTYQEGEVAMVEVVYDKTLLRFLPLCSVDAIDEYKFYKQGKLLVGERRMCTQGGKVRPPIRRQTVVAETEAKESGVIQIPQLVFDYFKRRCERPRCTRSLPKDLSFLRHRSPRPSTQEFPAEPSDIKTQEEFAEGKGKLQNLHGWNPLFTQWSNMTPGQIAQSETYNANSTDDYRLRQPIGHEEYLTQQVVAAESFRRTQAQKQREDERRRADTQADVTQRLATWEREPKNGTNLIAPTFDQAQRTQPSTYLQPSAHTQLASSTIAEPPTIRFSNDETPVHAAHIGPNPYPYPTTHTTAVEPQANGHLHSYQPQDNIDIRPDDAISKKGQGHPEKVKENKPFRMHSLTKSIGRGLGRVKSKLTIKSGRSQSPGPVSMQMAPRVKPVGFPSSFMSRGEVGV